MSKQKGTAAERELRNMLEQIGYVVVRAPASGGGADRPLPDLIAGNGKRYLAIEVKATKKKTKWIKKKQLEELLQFGKGFGAEPWVGVKFGSKTYWQFARVHWLIEHKKGSTFQCGTGITLNEAFLGDR